MNITEQNVLKYLQDNLNFFNKCPEILTRLYIPHDHGGTVSLIEKQIALLRDQHQKTQEKMDELMQIARQNEFLAKRLHQLTLALMHADSLQALLQMLYSHLQQDFNTDQAAVRLFANPSCPIPSAAKEFSGASAPEQSLFKNIVDKRTPFSGQMERAQQVFLFGKDVDGIASSIIIPLCGSNWSGILAIVSCDAKRFQLGMGVDLLTHFSEMLSAILETWIRR